MTVRKFSNYCAHSWQVFAETVLQGALLTVLRFKRSIKKHCSKGFTRNFRDIFHENNCTIHTNSVSISFLSPFWSVLETKNKNQILTKLVLVFLFFVYSQNFFASYSCSYYSSMIERFISMAASAGSCFFENIAEWLPVFKGSCEDCLFLKV